jgi:nucleotide-binding universal stress UspA family protein
MLCLHGLQLGTHVIGGMDRFVLGSTAEEVLRQASCPVITVGPHGTSKEVIGPDFHKVLYATDFSEASLAAVPFAAILRKSSSASRRVLHVSTDPDFVSASEDQSFDPVRKALEGSGPESTENATEYVALHGKDVSQAITNEAERTPPS